MESIKLNIVPLSINVAYKGRKFKTKAYKVYEDACLYMLPKMTIPKGKLEIWYEFGFSSTLSDLGNPEKLCTDILSKKYNFNDKIVFKMILEKKIVPKGEEYIIFQIRPYIE